MTRAFCSCVSESAWVNSVFSGSFLWNSVPEDCSAIVQATFKKKEKPHNVLTDHWAMVGHCNYSVAFDSSIRCVVFVDCATIAAVVIEFKRKNIASTSLLCFDAKVRLNFGWFGAHEAIVRAAKWLPHQLSLRLQGGEISQKGDMNQTFRRGGKENIPTLDGWLIDFKALLTVCFFTFMC